MKALRIGVDIDDVLVDWYGTAHSLSVAAGITNGKTPSSWAPFEEYGCTADEWYDVLSAATLDGTLYGQPPYEGAWWALKNLEDAGHSIHIVTARGFLAHGEVIRQQTIDWLDFYDIPHDSLTFSKRKSIVQCDVFVDDSEKNCLELLNHGVNTYMMNQPHNAHVEWAQRVNHISEFVDEVLA